MTHLRKMMLEEIQRRNLSKLTAECHLRAVEELALFYKRPPDQLGPEHIRQYQAHLFTDRKLDANTVAQHLSALRFFFIKTLKRNWSVEETPYPKRPIRLPDVLSREEVQRLIDSADSPLHRVWLLMLYATGLRREELVQLKVNDVDTLQRASKLLPIIRINAPGPAPPAPEWRASSVLNCDLGAVGRTRNSCDRAPAKGRLTTRPSSRDCACAVMLPTPS